MSVVWDLGTRPVWQLKLEDFNLCKALYPRLSLLAPSINTSGGKNLPVSSAITRPSSRDYSTLDSTCDSLKFKVLEIGLLCFCIATLVLKDVRFSAYETVGEGEAN